MHSLVPVWHYSATLLQHMPGFLQAASLQAIYNRHFKVLPTVHVHMTSRVKAGMHATNPMQQFGNRLTCTQESGCELAAGWLAMDMSTGRADRSQLV